MLENIFNVAGIAQKNHVMCQENNVVYYASSSNVIKCKNNKIAPIIRQGNDITNLKVRDGIILSDKDNCVELNNTILFESNDAIQAVKKSKFVSYNGKLHDVKAFCSFEKIYVFCDKSIFYVEQEGVITLDCIIIDGTVFLVCGTLDGKILKFTIKLDNLLESHKIGNNSLQTNRSHEYEHFYLEERKTDKIMDIKRLENYTVENIKAHDDTVTDIKINTSIILSSSQDKTIKIHNLQTFEHVDTLIGHSDYVYESNFVDKHNEIVSAGADNCVIIWEFRDGWKSKTRLGNLVSTPFYSALVINEKCTSFENGYDNEIEQKNEYFVMVHSYNGGIYRYCDTELVHSVGGHVDKITALAVKNDFILTGSLDRTVRLYYKMKEVARPCIHGYSVRSAVFYNNNVVVGSDESILRVYERTTGVEKILRDVDLKMNVESGDSALVTAVADDKREAQHENVLFIATPSELSLTNEIKKMTAPLFLNEHTLQNILCYREKKKIYAQFFANACLSSNDKIILCANKSSSLKFSGIFVIVDFVVVQYLAVHDLGIEKIEISDDGKYVVAVSRDKSVSFYRILDTSTDSPAGKDSTHNNGNNTTRFNESNAENVINKILNDSPYYLSLRKRIFSHSRRVNAASFDNLGTMFATGSKDRNVLIYSVDSLDVIETIKCEEEVTALRFHDRHLFVGLKNGVLKILKTDGYNQIYEQRIHAKSINEIKVNNNRLITISDDNMMRVFNINKV